MLYAASAVDYLYPTVPGICQISPFRQSHSHDRQPPSSVWTSLIHMISNPRSGPLHATTS